MSLRIQVDISKAVAGLDRLSQKQIPFALAQALTLTAKAVQAEEKAEMQRVFDRPTPYTLGSVYMRSASYKPGGWQPKNTTGTRFKSEYLTAYVGISDLAASKSAVPAGKFLAPEIYGGGRNLKRFESALRAKGLLPADMYCVPGRNVALDQYGNVPKSLIVRILSQLQAFSEAGYKANRTDRTRKSQLKRGVAQYFVGQPAGGKYPPGIWQRYGNTVQMVFMFVSQPHYRKRFKFFDVAIRTSNRVFLRFFTASMRDAMRTAR